MNDFAALHFHCQTNVFDLAAQQQIVNWPNQPAGQRVNVKTGKLCLNVLEVSRLANQCQFGESWHLKKKQK
jgi:hypothetical protein